ncbi:MAG: hypothetical protein HY078_09240 [Elusimicrobia bacterium]|nr:hypothetical protein [Elusimicrobiota bacterium]
MAGAKRRRAGLVIAVGLCAAAAWVWAYLKSRQLKRLTESVHAPGEPVSVGAMPPLTMTSPRQAGDIEFYAGPGGKIFMQGVEHANKQEDRAALVAFAGALRFDPKRAIVYASRAAVNERVGRAEDALRDYNRAIQLMPDDPAYRFARGTLLLRLGRRQDAQADCLHLSEYDAKAAESLCRAVNADEPR